MLTSPYPPFPPRPGHRPEGLSYDLNEIGATALDPAALSQVVSFEHGLYGAALPHDQFPHAHAFSAAQAKAGLPVEPLEPVWRRKVNSTLLGVRYFLTKPGKAQLQDVTGVRLKANSRAKAAKGLYGLDIAAVPPEALDRLEAASIGHEEAQLARAFMKGGRKGSKVRDPHIVTIYKNPDVLLQKVRGYQLYKGYLAHVRQDLRAEGRDDPATQAELLVTTLYGRRINNFLALLYADAFRLRHQHEQSGGHRHGEQVAGLHGVLPVLSYVQGAEASAGFLQRMDRFRFGVSRDEDGGFTWLSPEARALAAKAEQEGSEHIEVDRNIYSDIDPKLLEETKISGDTFGEWLSDVLATYGWRSTHTDWNAEREGPAPDGGWQVIVSDKFNVLEVNDKQRIVMVPKKHRSVLSAVMVGNHEIAHVIQHENKRAIGSLAILECIGLDSASEQTESGGVWQEQLAEGVLTGRHVSDIAGTGYLKALTIKAEGGTFGDAVEAYYYDLKRRGSKLPDEAVALRGS